MLCGEDPVLTPFQYNGGAEVTEEAKFYIRLNKEKNVHHTDQDSFVVLQKKRIWLDKEGLSA